MQFLLIAYDGNDADAIVRRKAARPAHLALSQKMKESGHLLYGAAILDETGEMKGSVLILEFHDRANLDDWLKEEPYVTGNVWEQIDIKSCHVAPVFRP